MNHSLSGKHIQQMIGFGIRRLRESNSHSLETFSKLLEKKADVNISPNMLGKIERGDYSINLNSFIKICLHFEIDLGFFLSDFLIKENHDNKNKILQNKLVKDIVTIILDNSDEQEILEEFKKILEAINHIKKVFYTETQNLKVAKKKPINKYSF